MDNLEDFERDSLLEELTRVEHALDSECLSEELLELKACLEMAQDGCLPNVVEAVRLMLCVSDITSEPLLAVMADVLAGSLFPDSLIRGLVEVEDIQMILEGAVERRQGTVPESAMLLLSRCVSVGFGWKSRVLVFLQCADIFPVSLWMI